jgi:predicted peptidase
MKKIAVLTGLLLLCIVQLSAQDVTAYKKEWFIKGKDSLPYRILLPENYNPAKKYPLILFLHGSGERGTDNEKQLTHGAKIFLNDNNRKKLPAIILFPQCPESSYWSNVDIKTDSAGKRIFNFSPDGPPNIPMILTEGLLKEIQKTFSVNKKQVYVMGLSMGGMGTFELVQRNPNLFAAAIPICGGANTAAAIKLKQTAWWIFHGAKDDVVDPDFSIKMAAALQQVKAKVKFTLYPEANHNSWDSAFAEPNFLAWLFKQHK